MLRSEISAASTLQRTVKSLESDKAQLQERMRALEKSLTAAQTSSPAAQASSPADTPTGKHVTCHLKKKSIWHCSFIKLMGGKNLLYSSSQKESKFLCNHCGKHWWEKSVNRDHCLGRVVCSGQDERGEGNGRVSGTQLRMSSWIVHFHVSIRLNDAEGV